MTRFCNFHEMANGIFIGITPKSARVAKSGDLKLCQMQQEVEFGNELPGLSAEIWVERCVKTANLSSKLCNLTDNNNVQMHWACLLTARDLHSSCTPAF